MHREKKYEVTKTQAYPLGVCFQQEGMRIAAVCVRMAEDHISDEFGVVLYDRAHKEGMKIPFPEEYRTGAVCSMLLKGYQDRNCRYLFYCGGRTWQDPYCKRIEGTYKYGVPRKSMQKCMPPKDGYDWGGDRTLGIPYEDVVFYALHVRGFTKHKSSGVKCRGTYAGVVEKIPYLQELGITSVLLMPSYEFDEIMAQENAAAMTMEQAAASYKRLPAEAESKEGDSAGQEKPYKVNYWGYQRGLYYVPKSGYAHSADVVTEFKDMVRHLHSNRIEALMQFYFPPEVSVMDIVDILKYWVEEYHIDGFHLMGADLPISDIAKEPLLSGTKLLTQQQYTPGPSDYLSSTRCIGWMDEGFLYDTRRAVKGDDDMLNQLIFHVRNNRPETGTVHYVAKWEGMRLADMVSYDHKHNEANGEDNQDGTDYNCSWNCGVEGKSRKKRVGELRSRQMKNALSLVFLSQGTPLLYSGDEFGNTQEGNNNPYCQDNAVTWIKWDQMERGRKLFTYTKMLIALRKAHPILHSPSPLKGMDYLSCGYPDISFHGMEAWRPDISPSSRCLGIMYCGYYGEIDGCRDDTLLYIGINLNWYECYLGLPQPPKGKEWQLYAFTGYGGTRVWTDMMSLDTTPGPKQEIFVEPRAIVIYMTQDRKKEV